jgi:argininosuccinate lyase
VKLWGGRFDKTTDELVEHFHSSITFDKRLYRHDILGSMAHATMLGEQGIINSEEAKTLVDGLMKILDEVEEGKIEFLVSAEDIHMNIEVLLTKKVGQVGKKLHTGRSRNDQVALDVRMYLKDEIVTIINLLKKFVETLIEKAKSHTDTIMPGYTHLQKAQPVSLAHHLSAYVQMLLRDIDRLHGCYRRVDVMPLGSGALAGTTFPLNRARVAELLGFATVTQNSMDAVSDRDFVAEFIFDTALIMMHLSRFAEELIFWSTNEVAFVEIDDAYATGSSIMPQKKNPDVAELVRGKTGRVYGDLISVLTMLKGLPLAYNKDMQEDKEALFDSIDTVKGALSVFIPMVDTMKIKKERMAEGAKGGFTNATEVADYLASKGLPFREAHEIVGKLVAYCLNQNKSLSDLSMHEWSEYSVLFSEDIYIYIDLKNAVGRRNLPGGPGTEAVLATISENEEYLAVLASWLRENPKKTTFCGRDF